MTRTKARALTLRWLGRVGYSAKGLVYALVGVLALMAALGVGGSIGGSKRALIELDSLTFGDAALGAVALGLFAYAGYRVLQALLDPGDHGLDVQGLGKRATYVVSAFLHAGLGLSAISLLLGTAGGDSDGSKAWTARLLQQPAGQWLVGLFGLIVLGFGLRQFQRAYQALFLDKMRESIGEHAKALVRRVGRVGLYARGVVLVLVGSFFVQAAIAHDPSESKGLGGALATLAEQPFGRWLLGLAAVGLAAYGAFCFLYVGYRDFERS